MLNKVFSGTREDNTVAMEMTTLRAAARRPGLRYGLDSSSGEKWVEKILTNHRNMADAGVRASTREAGQPQEMELCRGVRAENHVDVRDAVLVIGSGNGRKAKTGVKPCQVELGGDGDRLPGIGR